MKRGIFLGSLMLLILTHTSAQYGLDYYFSHQFLINPDIPSPEDVLDYQIGHKHVDHDHLVTYMRTLSTVSDRIRMETYGYTHEGRPLLLLTISDPENLKNISELKDRHRKISDPDLSREMDLSKETVVLWMGYSVHGNEPSGVNASLLVAYYLAANDSEEMKKILKNTIILLDPCINPDGYSRFSQWVNQFKSKVSISDPNNMEHNEPWPGGRTNHYWVDLNRDWLLLQQPESKARMIKFHEWLPNILTDHHEMGSNSTFFFQPGIPSRNNPNTPETTFLLTEKIANYHAAALDRIGSLYYTRETFDDFYYGKGSTYPDIHGSIGILFEQASSRGHTRKTDYGILTFPFTIRNQFITSLSTLQAGYELREELLDHQREFYIQARNDAREDPVKAYIFDAQDDPIKFFHFTKILEQHHIDLYRLVEEISFNGHVYEPDNTLIIPTGQKQYKLIKSLFDITIEYKDSLFYDVSSWTLPLAFDIHYDSLDLKIFRTLNLKSYLPDKEIPEGKLLGESSYGYLIRWHQYNAPMALYHLQEQGIRIQMAQKEFKTSEGKTFQKGTLFIPAQVQDIPGNKLQDILLGVALKTGIDIYPVASGYTTKGINLGSPNLEPLKKPEILLLIGEGISSYEAGEVWHLFDVRYQIPVTLIPIDQFNNTNLNGYNRIIMVNGDYNKISGQKKEEIKVWLESGGQAIAFKGGAKWLANQKLAFIQFRQPGTNSSEDKRYEDLDKDRGAQAIGGSIFKTKLDLTHPLCYGYRDDEVYLFKNSKFFFEKSKNSYNNPVVYTEDPLVSGYISRNNYQLIKNSSAVITSAVGKGKTICFSDNPNFRGFWFGTNRLFLNAVFLGDLIQAESAR